MFAMLTGPVFTNFAAACSKASFLGILQPWYQYLDMKTVTVTTSSGREYITCDVNSFNSLGGHSSFLLIGLAILDDLIRIAALVAVGYVIYGGIQYVTSQGSPDATKKAQQTIINALIGVVLAVLAASIVAFIGNRFGG
jgi:hypothetical protein